LSDLEELHSSVAASSNCLSNVQSHTVSGNLVWDLLSAHWDWRQPWYQTWPARVFA